MRSKLYTIYPDECAALIYCDTFIYGYVIDRHIIDSVENTDNFACFVSYRNSTNWYTYHNRNILIYSCIFWDPRSNKSSLGIEIIKDCFIVRAKEERIKILAEELLFHKRRKQLTKIVRAYKERRKQKILAEMEKYMPIDLCKIVKNYVQKIVPVIDCRFNKN